jgi:hypothetical protein
VLGNECRRVDLDSIDAVNLTNDLRANIHKQRAFTEITVLLYDHSCVGSIQEASQH